VKKVASDDWRERINAAMPSRSNTQRTMIFASTGEKGETTIPNQTGKSSGQRSLRTLPFSKDLFRLITNRFYIHGSIAKVISRADIPVFSNARIRMQDESGTTHPAYGKTLCISSTWV
jgi:hypothetical protein